MKANWWKDSPTWQKAGVIIAGLALVVAILMYLRSKGQSSSSTGSTLGTPTGASYGTSYGASGANQQDATYSTTTTRVTSSNPEAWHRIPIMPPPTNKPGGVGGGTLSAQHILAGFSPLDDYIQHDHVTQALVVGIRN